MGVKNKWIDFSLIGLCIVGLTGMVMRSKIVFSIPFINYNHLLEAHSHFTFAGWVTLGLATLMVYELLPPPLSSKRTYQWILGSILVGAWAMLLAYYFDGYAAFSIFSSFVFILVSIFFAVLFISDIKKTELSKATSLMAVSSIVCLLLSSLGTFVIAYIYFTKSFDAILYRDALFTYLHFQYNGFFSMAIFALLFNYLEKKIDREAQKKLNRFAIVLVISILPSLFLSYLWADPNMIFRVIAIAGSLILLLCCYLFLDFSGSVRSVYFNEKPIVRVLLFISMGSFLLKSFLQCFTIFPIIGNAIFGNRPIIMGFLHLVFLAFTSLFILAFLTKKGLVDAGKKFTKTALLFFATAIVLNEVVLIGQGLTTILMPGSIVVPWLLWAIGICLFAGTILVGIARIKTKQSSNKKRF